MKLKKLTTKNFYLLSFAFLLTASILVRYDSSQRPLPDSIFKNQIRAGLGEFHNYTELPQTIDIQIPNHFSEKVQVEYTIDPEMQAFGDRLLKSYKPDYGAMVLLNAETGEVLGMNTYSKNPNFTSNLALTATYPAASIFKIIPAAAAIDKYNYNSTLSIGYNGSKHSLYRRNALADRSDRWTRFVSLEDAFAFSVNTAFARLALSRLEPKDLEEYALRFAFNVDIHTDFYLPKSLAGIPLEKNFEMAEFASGFNRINRLSPVHGALLAASIANDGKMNLPYIVKTLKSETGEIVYDAKTQLLSTPFSYASSLELRKLMGATISRGTSRGTFRRLLKDNSTNPIEIGGKTGSLTGEEPQGKVDWFVGYAIKDNTKLAIAAVTVHKEFWTVRSSHLAQEIFRRYYKNLEVSQNTK